MGLSLYSCFKTCFEISYFGANMWIRWADWVRFHA